VPVTNLLYVVAGQDIKWILSLQSFEKALAQLALFVDKEQLDL